MIEWFSFIAIISFRIFSVFLGIWKANGDFDILETIYFMGLRIVKIWFELCFPQKSGSFQLSQDGHMLIILLELLCYDGPRDHPFKTSANFHDF